MEYGVPLGMAMPAPRRAREIQQQRAHSHDTGDCHSHASLSDNEMRAADRANRRRTRRRGRVDKHAQAGPSTNRRIQTISGKKEAECKGKEAQTRGRANQGGWRSNIRSHSTDRTTKRHTRNGADLPRRSASKACSSSIGDRWLGPCCSVRAAAQRLLELYQR